MARLTSVNLDANFQPASGGTDTTDTVAALVDRFGDLDDAAETNPAAASASLLALFRGLMDLVSDNATLAAGTSGGWSWKGFVADGTAFALNIKNGAGQLAKAIVICRNTTQTYLKLYNSAATPDPSAGGASNTPVPDSVYFPIPILANSIDGYLSLDLTNIAVEFTTGIGAALVTSATVTSEAPPASGQIIALFLYK